jgi:hypothetical protein
LIYISSYFYIFYFINLFFLLLPIFPYNLQERLYI